MCALARARAPSAPRAHAPRARTSGTSCDSPWLQSLKIWSLRQTRSGSMADEARREEIRKIADVIEVKLRARNCKCWIRGKFLSWWFSHYFNSVAKKLAREFRDQNNLDIQCGLTMGQKQFIALLTHHAGVPKRLRLFFERRLGGSNSVALV